MLVSTVENQLSFILFKAALSCRAKFVTRACRKNRGKSKGEMFVCFKVATNKMWNVKQTQWGINSVLTGEIANRRMVPFLISPRLWERKREQKFDDKPTAICNSTTQKDTEAHLLRDIKLGAVRITQRELLRAWQRPAEEGERQKKRVKSWNGINCGAQSKLDCFTAPCYPSLKNKM